MRRPFKSLLLVGAVSLSAVATAPIALGAEACPNEQLRIENNSTELPDCRAYELVTPDLNHAVIATDQAGLASPDGNTLVYAATDAPNNAKSAQAFRNRIRSERDPVSGWSGVSLSPPLAAPVDSFLSFATYAESADLSSTFEVGDQPLTGAEDPSGFNAFVGRDDGTYRLLTHVGSPFVGGLAFLGGNPDFSQVYFEPGAAQLPSDPFPGGGSTYSWSEARGLRLLGILPDDTPAPDGGSLAGNIVGPVSDDGSRAAFTSDGNLYLRVDDTHTFEVSASQRTVAPDPNPGPALATIAPFAPQTLAGITATGSSVLFVAHSELTNDANTGSSAGVATDAGADLYSYDTATGHLSDLTVDTDPADVATGANVTSVLGASPDGSYIYFAASGDLAQGATPGHASLYVWHAGQIQFVAPASGIYIEPGFHLPRFYVTPDGRHAVFPSIESLTGYDNTDTVTGRPHVEVFESTVGAPIRCASCRPNGTPPTADSELPTGVIGLIRGASDDGRRVFFQSTDAVVPQASNGLQKIFEYEDGTPSLISGAGSSSNAFFENASASGDDVFFTTFDELIANPEGGESAIYDARVGGGFPATVRDRCAGTACHAPQPQTAAFHQPETLSTGAPGNVAAPAPAVKPSPKPLTRSQKLAKALRACRAKHNSRKRARCQKHARRVFGGKR